MLLGYPFLPQQFTESGVMELIVDADVDGPEKIRGQFTTGLISTSAWIESNSDQACALCESINPVNDAVMDPAIDKVVRTMLVENAALSGAALGQIRRPIRRRPSRVIHHADLRSFPRSLLSARQRVEELRACVRRRVEGPGHASSGALVRPSPQE